MITLAQAKALKHGDVVITAYGERWRVNGKVKTWVTRPSDVRVPMKHGLYCCDYLTQDYLHTVTLVN